MSMSMDEFRTLLDAWGADPGRWPNDRRAAAEALIARSEEAKRMLADEAAFDALLARTLLEGTPAGKPDAALTQRILAIPQSARQERRAGGWRFGFLPALPRFAGLAAAAVIGFYIGTTSLFQPSQSLAADSETVNISDYVFGDTETGGADTGSMGAGQ
jgi:anti-sigma factor RsiW